MHIRKMSFLSPAIALLVSGVACLAIGLASEQRTFLWMAPGFIVPGLVLARLATRREAR